MQRLEQGEAAITRADGRAEGACSRATPTSLGRTRSSPSASRRSPERSTLLYNGVDASPGRALSRDQRGSESSGLDGRHPRSARRALRRRAHARPERQRRLLDREVGEGARARARAAHGRGPRPRDAHPRPHRDGARRGSSSATRSASSPRTRRATSSRSWPTSRTRRSRRRSETDFGTEQAVVHGKEVYSWHPDGLQRSKLASLVADGLGTVGTARNWNTVEKLRELTSE